MHAERTENREPRTARRKGRIDLAVNLAVNLAVERSRPVAIIESGVDRSETYR
jgi:hypothetical protein